MPNRRATAACISLMTLLSSAASIAQMPQSHRDLDWNAPRRWVHVDNVLPERVGLFEGARLEWLSVLRTGDSLLGDGRPLFWHAQGEEVQTYFTFYPFRAMAELDERVRMIEATNKVVGEQAGQRYDRGDSGLVSPHCSQIWRRLVDDDIAWPGTDTLTELTGAVGQLDIHMPDLQRYDEVDSLWSEIKAALISHKYPLACRVYGTIYGSGETMMLWLAPDSAAHANAPSVENILVQEYGESQGRAKFARFKEVFPIQKSYKLVRRPDLCNLGR